MTDSEMVAMSLGPWVANTERGRHTRGRSWPSCSGTRVFDERGVVANPIQQQLGLDAFTNERGTVLSSVQRWLPNVVGESRG